MLLQLICYICIVCGAGIVIVVDESLWRCLALRRCIVIVIVQIVVNIVMIVIVVVGLHRRIVEQNIRCVGDGTAIQKVVRILRRDGIRIEISTTGYVQQWIVTQHTDIRSGDYVPCTGCGGHATIDWQIRRRLNGRWGRVLSKR